MARRFRLWEKKRGDRLTGSRWVGSVGEAAFYAALALIGALTMFALIRVDYLQGDRGGISKLGSWLIFGVFVSLISIGVLGFIYTLLNAGTSAERRLAFAKRATNIDLLEDHLSSRKDYPNVPRDVNLTNSPGTKLAYRLPIAKSPGWHLLASGVFAILWNGMVSVLIWFNFSEHFDLYLLGLTILFGIAGIIAIAYFFRMILLTTAIGPTSLEISDQPIYPGRCYQIFLSQAGRLSVKSLVVTLVCEEEATYRQGTDTRTERRRVHEEQIFSKQNFEIMPVAPFEQLSELQFPKAVMHSFQSDHNAVHWRLVVEGVVEKWPRFQRNFPLVVYPDRKASPNMAS